MCCLGERLLLRVTQNTDVDSRGRLDVTKNCAANCVWRVFFAVHYFLLYSLTPQLRRMV